ncbi:hypothetical protein [Bradyrhizobium arachidis]|uniref:Uncharacterized protein n=1 Tax=Bradyrhizobium arachidis TaxID=858423 RepID=A0AAE7NGG0_9BRAD|nr:hypothetical protein [Bradyrhizobium arachidis]QOZ65893.1 hypothetical protein WN72_05270 [Bradyrhizobium arachidis]
MIDRDLDGEDVVVTSALLLRAFGHVRSGFSHSEKTAGDGRSPWVITGGLSQNLLVVDDIRIRTDAASLAFGAAIELGEITSVGGNFYLRAALRKMETVTINIGSGRLEDPPPLGPIFHYTRWSAGVVRDKPLIEFPFAKGP